MELLIVDDHPLFREALASTIGLSYPEAVLHEADGIASACAVLAAHRDIELTLLDLSMQGVSGFDGLVTIRARFPRVPILVVSGHEEPRIMREALHHGAAAHDDAGRVLTHRARRALDLERHVPQLAVLVAPGCNLRDLLGRLGELDGLARLLRHELGAAILLLGHLERLRDAAQRRGRAHRHEVRHAGHPRLAILVQQVGEDLVAAGGHEVEVGVGKVEAFRVDEALEQKAETDRIAVSDAHEISDQRTAN
ncbi:response regulator transcription factor [Methylobacterium sp. WL103]|uniref:response regulator n=1 Tax=Methylobacterium sp. WL103 TaxID=2603891 RepID=UPI0011CCB1E6|nr:response regulator [Methylobacterium sp. WL103]TXN07955.1 response regulator transcription factor [Methylobacterium sp. WL103]